MKVIKRNGKGVDYDRDKIRIAIGKANETVIEEERVTSRQIENIIKYIEGLNKKRMLVEDIQDIIEEKLMSLNKFSLAKNYIIYRYNRALARKSNTTDESILSLIKNTNYGVNTENSNKNASVVAMQRDYISDMLEHGFVINGKMIEQPKSFQVACTITTQIIASVTANQYGGQSIDLSHLGKYIRISREKIYKKMKEKYNKKLDKEILESIVNSRLEEEIKAGVQTLQYQINTLWTTNGQAPFVTLFLNLREDDPYIEENAMFFEEVLKQRYEGIKNEKVESMII